jgi:hypothetical protein
MLRVFVGAGLAPALPGNALTVKIIQKKKGNHKGLPLHCYLRSGITVTRINIYNALSV